MGNRALVGLLLLAAAPARAQITVDPTSIDFQTVKVGQTSAPIGLSVINGGNSDVLIDSVTLGGPPGDRLCDR